MAKQELVRVDLIALVEDQVSSNPIVVLHDKKGNKLLPIWIGDAEARAIAVALKKPKTHRPMTHQLLLNVISGLGGKLLHVVVDRMEKNTFFASMHVLVGGGEIAIDARPSDAITIAIQGQIPLFVDKKIMDVAGQPNPVSGIVMERTKGMPKLNEDELQKLKKLLDLARERERESGGV